MAFLRISISLLGLATAIVVAYFAMWKGLGGGPSLSPADSAFAVTAGAIYGVILIVFLNVIPYHDRKRTLRVAAFAIIGLHIVFGLGFMIWTAAIASA